MIILFKDTGEQEEASVKKLEAKCETVAGVEVGVLGFRVFYVRDSYKRPKAFKRDVRVDVGANL